MAGVSKAVRELRARVAKVNESRVNTSAEALAKGGLDWYDALHQMGHDEDADRLHRKFSYAVEALERDLVYNHSRVGKFAAELEVNPAYAFEWADGAMESAAVASVDREFLAWYKAKGPDAAYDYANRKALGMARSPSRSTSPSHNTMALYYTAAWAKLVEDRRWSLGF